MSETVTIPFGDDNAQTARELLELAGPDPAVVRTGENGFIVPSELAARWPGRDARGRAPVADGQYDPSRHSAAEVLEYLESADGDEQVRVHRAEAAGKNRKTIAEWRPAGGADDTEGA